MTRLFETVKVISNETVAAGVYSMMVYAPATVRSARPGQFVHLKLNQLTAPLLRRPLSIAGANPGTGEMLLIYRVVGEGTELLSRVLPGGELDSLGPLGTSFALDGRRPLLVGGGVGLAPLLYLAGELCPRPIEVVMGGRTREDMFWSDLFTASCEKVHITTDDGSLGTRGFAADILPELLAGGAYDYIYTCGPQPMMAAVARVAREHNIPCQASLEEYMACGVGGCLVCTCAGSDGKRRKVCTDGPVFMAEEVLF